MLLSLAMTEGAGFTSGREKRGMKSDSVDIWRSYLCAANRREVYVDMPQEDYETGVCG